MVEIRHDDVGELDLEQIDVLAQDERQQQVERAAEDVEIELQLGGDHGEDRSDRTGSLGPPAPA